MMSAIAILRQQSERPPFAYPIATILDDGNSIYAHRGRRLERHARFIHAEMEHVLVYLVACSNGGEGLRRQLRNGHHDLIRSRAFPGWRTAVLSADRIEDFLPMRGTSHGIESVYRCPRDHTKQSRSYREIRSTINLISLDAGSRGRMPF
jgi:hypothetical protein